MSVTISRVGSDLRGARERLGYTLPAIAAHLRIRLPFLEAIEEGRIADLPGNAYALGFIRTYAQALGLDPDEIARRFKAEAAEVNRKTELDFPAPVPERGIPAGAIVLLGGVILLGAYFAWYRVSGRDQPEAHAVPPVPERLAALAANPPASVPPLSALPASTPSPAPAAPSPSPAPSNVATPPAPAAPPLAAAAPSQPMAAPLAGTQLPRPGAPTSGQNTPQNPPGSTMLAANNPGVSVPQLANQPPAAVPPPAPGESRMMLRAKADAWIQVREKGGAILLNRVLRPGETWPVPVSKVPLLMTTGNAAGTELLVDGVVTASLGGDGAVRRDLTLDADMARDGKLAPGGGVPASGAGATSKPGAPSVTRTN